MKGLNIVMRYKTKEMVILSMLGGVIFLGQYIFQFIPNFEIVSLFIIIFSLIYDKKILRSIFIFIFLMGVSYGFGIWILGYIIIWPLLSIATILLKKHLIKNYLRLSLYSGMFGFLFGFFYSIAYILFGGFKLAFTYWIQGIYFDVIHMIGNYFIMLFVGERLYNIMVKLNLSYFRGEI